METRPEIMSRQGFRAVGWRRVYGQNGQRMEAIPLWWGELAQSGGLQSLGELSSFDPPCTLGLCRMLEEGKMEYWIAAPSEKPLPDGMEEIQIAGGAWALFDAGDDASSIREVFDWAYGKWLPGSDFVRRTGPDIEFYEPAPDGTLRVQVWLPVERAKRPSELERLLDESGKLKLWPAKKSTQRLALSYLAEKFEPAEAREYTEREVNALIESWHTFGDFFLLRRELIEGGFLKRLPNGSKYWR
jgi:predicted transcriptional regulator YdeE